MNMRARLLADQNVDNRVCIQLRRLGHDVVTVHQRREDARASGPPDAVVLEIAIADRRAVLTDNRKDFIRLHREQGHHFGVIVCDVHPDCARKAKAIDAQIRETLRELKSLEGQLLTVRLVKGE